MLAMELQMPMHQIRNQQVAIGGKADIGRARSKGLQSAAVQQRVSYCSASKYRAAAPITQRTIPPPKISKKTDISQAEISPPSNHKPKASHRTAKMQNAQQMTLPNRSPI